MRSAAQGRAPVVAIVGMATLDYLYMLEHYPGADTVTPALEHQTSVGGVAGRSAVAAARLGGSARLLATCGTGVHADVLRAELEAEGVECTWIVYGQPSQHSTVILARADATRTIIWLPQPMADTRATAHLPEFLAGADVALLDATDATLAAATLDECERRRIPTVLDTGSGRPWTRTLVERADHVIAPEVYVCRETGLPADQAARELWEASACTVLGVTQGPRGGIFVTGDEPRRLQRWAAVPVAGVDSCGAGDTFHGAYAWALAAGLSVAERFELAAWSAALKVTQLGNRGIPTLDQLERARASGAAGGHPRA